jgi:peptidoglycan/xylan/chitin deacetylase (PgdA/CDA1 family)
VMDGSLNLYAGCLCWLLRLPLVQELCEWLPGEPCCSSFTRWLHKGPIFRLATGVLVISRVIEARARACAEAVNPALLMQRLPAIVDASRFAATTAVPGLPATPRFVYCGTWLRDVFFLIRAFVSVKKSGYQCELRIVGNSDEQVSQVRQYAAGMGLSPEEIVMLGCVDETTLESCYKTATALLLPLPDDDRSRTRLPNKLSEYLASGRPVVTCRIGDLTSFLTRNVSAFMAEPGNEDDFAEQMLAVLRDPEHAGRIGAAGQQACFKHLDYRRHTAGLAAFFRRCFDVYSSRRPARRRKSGTNRAYMALRNCVCGSLGLGLILAGQVRRARKHAFAKGAVTAVYFHNPNPRLLRRCIDWLVGNGYHFISASDVMGMLYNNKVPPRGAVWLSFDDGFSDLLEHAVPLLEKRGIPVTFFVPSGIIAGNGCFPWLRTGASLRARDAMTVAQTRRLAQYPIVTIGSHTVSHAVTQCLTPPEAEFEIGASKRTLESWVHAPVECFAYPEGRFGGWEPGLLKEHGYRLAATTENDLIVTGTNPYFVPRFSVADEIWFAEAICHMVGVWRPVRDSLSKFLSGWRDGGGTPEDPLSAAHVQIIEDRL